MTKLSEKLKYAMDSGDPHYGISVHPSIIKELEALENEHSKACLAVKKTCYDCQDFNDPPYCNDYCDMWSLRFALNVRNMDIWPEEEVDGLTVEEGYEKAKALRG